MSVLSEQNKGVPVTVQILAVVTLLDIGISGFRLAPVEKSGFISTRSGRDRTDLPSEVQ